MHQNAGRLFCSQKNELFSHNRSNGIASIECCQANVGNIKNDWKSEKRTGFDRTSKVIRTLEFTSNYFMLLKVSGWKLFIKAFSFAITRETFSLDLILKAVSGKSWEMWCRDRSKRFCTFLRTRTNQCFSSNLVYSQIVDCTQQSL